MGGVLSHAASGAGAFLGNLVTAPLKSLFGGSCDGICAGPWDVGCFIEHLCISNLFKFVLILALCYIIVVFVYLLFKVGIFQCVIKSICKMCWTACATYCYALHHIICCLCDKLSSVPRHHRRRNRRGHFHDIERGGRRGYASDHHTPSSTSTSTSQIAGGRPHHGHLSGISSSSRKRKSSRMLRDGGKRRRFHGGHRSRRGVRMRGAKDGGVTGLRSSRRRRIRVVKGKKKKKPRGGGYGSFKRQRVK